MHSQGRDSRTLIICELSQTHEGSPELAKILIKSAAAAKADAVKFQVFSADELAVPEYKHYPLFRKLEWPAATWRELINFSHQNGIKAFADVFGIDSTEMLLKNGIDGLKIHNTDMRNIGLLQYLADSDIPLLLSVGGSLLEEVKTAISILISKKEKEYISLIYGFQSYPTLVEETNLKRLKYFRDNIGRPVGYADHIDGDHDLNFSLCAAAIGMGATIIEKHITLSRHLRMEDYESALSPDLFARFVSHIRELDSAMGTYSGDLSAAEIKYRSATRKQVVAINYIKKGEVIKETDVALKRTNSETTPLEISDVIGKTAMRNFTPYELILKEDLN